MCWLGITSFDPVIALLTPVPEAERLTDTIAHMTWDAAEQPMPPIARHFLIAHFAYASITSVSHAIQASSSFDSGGAGSSGHVGADGLVDGIDLHPHSISNGSRTHATRRVFMDSLDDLWRVPAQRIGPRLRLVSLYVGVLQLAQGHC